jgi:hypothetical protein
MRFGRFFATLCVASGLMLVACHEHTHQGPAERAGEKIDNGLSKLGDKMQEGGEKLQDKAHGD